MRIAAEGQYRLPDGDAERLNELDNRRGRRGAGRRDGLQGLWNQMLELVASDGNEARRRRAARVRRDCRRATYSFREAKGEFSGEGLIPDDATRGLAPRTPWRLAGLLSAGVQSNLGASALAVGGAGITAVRPRHGVDDREPQSLRASVPGRRE